MDSCNLDLYGQFCRIGLGSAGTLVGTYLGCKLRHFAVTLVVQNGILWVLYGFPVAPTGSNWPQSPQIHPNLRPPHAKICSVAAKDHVPNRPDTIFLARVASTLLIGSPTQNSVFLPFF